MSWLLNQIYERKFSKNIRTSLISVPGGRFPRALPKVRKDIVQSFPPPRLRCGVFGYQRESELLSPSLPCYSRWSRHLPLQSTFYYTLIKEVFQYGQITSYNISKTPAAPIPPPIHMVTTPNCLFCRLSSFINLRVKIEPVAPSG